MSDLLVRDPSAGDYESPWADRWALSHRGTEGTEAVALGSLLSSRDPARCAQVQKPPALATPPGFVVSTAEDYPGFVFTCAKHHVGTRRDAWHIHDFVCKAAEVADSSTLSRTRTGVEVLNYDELLGAFLGVSLGESTGSRARRGHVLPALPVTSCDVEDFVLLTAANVSPVNRLLEIAALGLSADEETALAADLPEAGLGRTAVSSLRDALRRPAASLGTKRFAILALGYLRDLAELRAALRSGEPTMQEAALDAIAMWKLAGADADLRAVAADPNSPSWIRDYAEDLLG